MHVTMFTFLACIIGLVLWSQTASLRLGSGFANQRQYIDHLKLTSNLPKGFAVGTTRFMFKPFEVDKLLPMNVTLIVTDKPSMSFAAMFTSNLFPGGPIYVGRERMASSEAISAVVINNKISNVCPGGSSDFGAGDSDKICAAVARKLKLGSKSEVFPSSTGIIGKSIQTRID